jgi:hypothetical protein
MADIKRLASSALLVLGVLLVFFGLNAALGFTAGGLIASAAVIGALLYSGAIWFSPRPPAAPNVQFTAPVVFDRDGCVVSGGVCGQPLSAQFPEPLRAEVHQRCAAALAGVAGRFAGEYRGRAVVFEFLPVRNGNGSVVYGLVVTSEAMAPALAASA